MSWFGCVLLSLLILPQDKSSDLQTRPFECTGLYIVPVRVYDQDVLGLIDTGSTACILDKEFFKNQLAAEAVDRNEEISLADGRRVSAPVFTLPIQIAGCKSAEVLTTAIDINTFDNSDFAFQVIVGMSYLENQPIRFNGNYGKFAQITDELELPQSPAITLRRTKKKAPLVPVSLPLLGVRDFEIATGLNGAIEMEPDRLQQLERGGHAVRVPEAGTEFVNPDGSKFEVKRYWLRKIDICGVRFDNVMVATGTTSLVSMSILKHFDLTIDCNSNRLWMNSLQTIVHCPLGLNGMDGMGFAAKFDAKRQLLIQENMDADGLAIRSGIRPGDEIIEINGMSVDEYTYYSVKEEFSQASINLSLKFRRDGKDFDVDIKLKDDYPFPPEWPPEPEEFNPDAVPEKRDDAEP